MDERSLASSLAALPATFRYSQARRTISDRQLRRLMEREQIVRVARGLYRKNGADGDEDLAGIVAKSPRATLCLRTALARHGLIDDIPYSIDIALPRNTWHPATHAPVTWHHFDPATFDVGRQTLTLDTGTAIGLYSQQRCIIDAFRMRHVEGPELGNEALRRWLRSGGQPSLLLRTAHEFPRATAQIRRSLEVLL